ncbi:MAG: AbrB/MazE/SpoVT family DNA-binding domain-containing protein [Nanoarchaeota archaeon]|nr:AbrB/MazE/SpoVT family DNA-binding domain-containing protein [Nanoarchaeota archaeon]
MSANRSRLQFPNKKQYTITIPKSLVGAKGWKKGDELEFVLDNKGDIVLKKVKNARRK